MKFKLIIIIIDTKKTLSQFSDNVSLVNEKTKNDKK
jgi:hypothetical protein